MADVLGYFASDLAFNNCCHVTFDDGERAFLDHALPVLQAMGVPASLFVSPQVLAEGRNYWFQDVRALRQELGDARFKQQIAVVLDCPAEALAAYGVNSILKNMRLADIERVIHSCQLSRSAKLATVDHARNMTPDEVRTVDRGGLVTIGAHTMTHPILANESNADAEQQITQSVQTLAGWLGRPVETFAYPNGASGLDYGPREQAILRRCGVKLAFTTDTGFYNRRTAPLAIPRAALDGSPRETPAWITAKLLAVPVWEWIRRSHEAQERRALRERLCP
jgi:peptidoglycan/xylan/chitin deacetylase (PgdA/CDA1 family)